MRVEVIEIPNHFSVNEAAKLREASYALLEKEPIRFELDFRKCEFIDSTGLGVLVGLFKKCAEKKSEMIMKNITPNVETVLKMTRLNQVFKIV